MSLVEKKTTIALRCPHCGRLESKEIQVFEFSGGQTLEVECSCGQQKAILARDSMQEYLVHYLCAICEGEHLLSLKNGEFWGELAVPINCPEASVRIGTIGSQEAVHNDDLYRDSLESLAEKLGGDDYFSNPAIMLDILDILQDMAMRGRVSCMCGSKDIQIDLYPDRLKLVCAECSGNLTIPAQYEEDLEDINCREGLFLARNIDGLRT